MCGIIAFHDPKQSNKSTVIEAMMDLIRHRGPSSGGKFVNDQVALGFRRLSIIDLDGGTQPIYNEDGKIVITFNGEIYNYQSLRTQLQAAGHQFKTKSDTEVLLHGYEEWGMAGLLQQVRGMFSFLIWDDHQQKLLGARDFFGIKPLYYYHQNGTFIVGSEIKSFLVYPDFQKKLNHRVVKNYLMNQYNDLEETFFEGVQRFPAGHWFELQGDHFHLHQYWDAHYELNHHRSFKETVKAIDDTLTESVKLHNIADVPVGAFLSEGVDSSYVTTLLNPQEVFSVSFDDQTYNEASAAQDLAHQHHWHFNETKVTAAEAFRDFPEMQYHLDEPDANPSVVPLWYLCRLARTKVTVALSGEGADELFAGYVNYGMHTHHTVVRVFGDAVHHLPKSWRYNLAKTVKRLPNFPGKVHLYTHTAEPSAYYVGESVIYDLSRPSIFSATEANAILAPGFQNTSTISGTYAKDFKKVAQVDEVKQMQYIDLHHFMLNDILQKADKISMAHSLELRVPYLDRQVAELANSIPTKYLVDRHDTKYALRQAAAQHLPADWSTRPKLGFPVPVKAWLRQEKYYHQVRSLFQEPWVATLVDQAAIIALLDDNFLGKRDARRQIWVLYTFLVWYRVYFVEFEQSLATYGHVQPEVQAMISSGKLV